MVKSHKITPEQRKSLLAKQRYQCAICGVNQSSLKRRLAVDHDHADGEIRGLLCSNCNLGLGLFKDRPEILAAAIRYLSEHDAYKRMHLLRLPD